MGKKKCMRVLFSDPIEMRIQDVIIILAQFGYKLNRIKGSHFQFNNGKRLLTIPVHHGKVKKYYLREIKSIILNLG